jgi:hypothetical protein
VAAGAEFTVSVTTTASCPWTAASGVPFIAPMGNIAATGSGTARFTVQANAGAPRQGTVQVAGRNLNVVQAGTVAAICEFALAPTSATVAVGGGDVSVAITSTSGTDCPWTASGNDAFITVKSGASGNGAGTTVLSASPNGGVTRVGTAVVAGKSVSILQDGVTASNCAFSVTPTQFLAPPTGANIVINVTRTQGNACPWVAQSQSAFLTVSGTGSGTDDGSVTIVAGPNGGALRTGTVVVAGQSVTINQSASAVPCVLTIQPTTANVLGGGGNTFTIVTNSQGSSCPWTAQSQSPFITVINGSSGVDTGGVTVRVDPNPGGDRQGTVLVAGHIFTVVQAGASSPCGFRLAPTSISAGAATMSVFSYITMISGQNCAWSAQSSAPFARVEPASGVIDPVGYSTVLVVIDANTGPARTATITVGNATMSISQAGALPSNAAAVLSFQSEPGDNIGQGQSQSFTFTNNQFEVTADPAAGTVTFNTPIPSSPFMSLALAAPSGQPLTAGYYPVAQRFASAGVAGVSFGYNGRGCNQTTGRLLVSEAVYGPGNTVQRFHARFEQHCEGHSPALHGQIWIDAQGSTTPPPLPPFPPPGSGTTFFSYQSEPGDVVGGGGSGNFTLANGIFTAWSSSSQNEVSIGISSNPQGTASWHLLFAAPTGQQVLPGTYDPAKDPAQSAQARLRVTGWGSCSGTTLNGKFTVIEVLYGTGGTVLRFHATFELRCGTAAAAFRGEIRILADPWR